MSSAVKTACAHDECARMHHHFPNPAFLHVS